MAEVGKRIELSEHVKFRIRLAHRQGLLSQGGSVNRVQQWALAWLIREEEVQRIEQINSDRENLLKTMMYVHRPEVYNQLWGTPGDIEDTDNGEDFSRDEFDDIDAFLKGQHTMTAADIFNGGDWF